MGSSLVTRFKSWWKYTTIGEKAMAVLDVIGAGAALYCAHKVNQVNKSVDISHMTVTMRGEKALMELIEARRITIETPDMTTTARYHRSGEGTPCTEEEAQQAIEDCAD